MDVNLNFNDQISDLCKKSSRKISSLATVTPFMDIKQKKIINLMNAFLVSQFSHYPLICMCHSRSNNRKRNMLHERCVRIICNDKQSYFTELLSKENSVSIHIRNIPRLTTEMFRLYTGLSSPLINNIFKIKAKNPYNLRQVSEFSRPVVKSVYHRTERIPYLGPRRSSILYYYQIYVVYFTVILYMRILAGLFHFIFFTKCFMLNRFFN